MRRAIAAAAALLAAAGCRKEPEPPTPVATVYEWAQQSPDKRFELRQRRDQAGCRVEAVVKPDDRVLWTSQTCLPAPSGLAFLSPNGERLLVLDLFPSSQVAQGPDWSHVPLVACWSRGAVVREYTGSELLSAAQVTDMRKVLSWVRGDTFEQAHAAARASPDGSQLTIDLVDGRSLTLGFDGEALPAPPAAAAPPPGQEAEAPARPPAGTAERSARAAGPAPLDEQALYSWEDDQGGLHFGAGAQVPPRFRKRALPVTGSVGVMPLDRPTPAAQQPAAAKETPAAGAPATPAAAAAPAAAPGSAAPAPGAAAPAPAAPSPPPAAPAAGGEGSGR
jgi:hypothetical protein